MHGFVVYENHTRIIKKFHYAQEDWKRPREKKTSSKKDTPLSDLFASVHKHKHYPSISLFIFCEFIHLCVKVEGENMKADHFKDQ